MLTQKHIHMSRPFLTVSGYVTFQIWARLKCDNKQTVAIFTILVSQFYLHRKHNRQINIAQIFRAQQRQLELYIYFQ